MEKVRIVTIESLSEEQVREDMAMTPTERLEVAFRLSDLAVEIQQKSKNYFSSLIYSMDRIEGGISPLK